jgi:hypothetical protein
MAVECRIVSKKVRAAMRYLLNLPLLAALFGIWWLVKFRLLDDEPGLGPSLAVAIGTISCWVLVAVVLAGCILTGAFDWLQMQSRGGSFALVLGVFGLVTLLSLASIGIAMEAAPSIRAWQMTTAPAARLVTIGIPVVLLTYSACLINGPTIWRMMTGWQYGVLMVLAGLSLVAIYVSVGEINRRQEIASANQAADQLAADSQGQEQRRAMQALSDADPLIQWDQFVGANVPADVRAEALRRIAARPTLEADLTAALTNENTLWSNEALSLMLQLAFKPSPALEAPVRTAFAHWTAALRDKSNDTGGDGDRYVDLYQTPQLGRALSVTKLMAEQSGIDLGDALDAIQQAVVEVYPTSSAAASFPGEVADMKRQIRAILAK